MAERRRSPWDPLPGLGLWLLASFACTLALWLLRDRLHQAHLALAYLLVVLGGSAREGRVVGLVMAVVCFLLFNFFLLQPLYSWTIEDPLDWWILVAFLITGTVAAQLLHRAQHAAALAEERAVEIQRLAREAEHVAALKEADRLKDALLATVSHDLRTPLTSIRATAAEIREDGHASAAIIEEEAERLNRLVTDLLDFSRIRAGALPVEAQLNTADDLIGAALDRVKGLVGVEERVDVRLPAEATLMVGRFDFVQSLRALVNLLENALVYSRPGSRVELELELDGDELVFAVRDRGPGVPEKELSRLFEPFHRGEDARSKPGTGLGLAIAQEVARAQGGSVVYRPRSGGGSVFELRLPAAEAPGLS